jgi:hypothetical protein
MSHFAHYDMDSNITRIWRDRYTPREVRLIAGVTQPRSSSSSELVKFRVVRCTIFRGQTAEPSFDEVWLLLASRCLM